MAAKPTPARKAPGQPVQEWQRHTVLVGVRCSRELADRARSLARTRGCTLADMLRLGADRVEAGDELCPPVTE